RMLQVSAHTIASWTPVLDQKGPDALVQLPEPVNRFPEFVGYVVRRLQTLCPTLGKVKIAQILARAGRHLSPTTGRRMLHDRGWPGPCGASEKAPRAVTARHPNQVWHVDLTTVPTALGFCTSWLPFTLPQIWPFCWLLTVTVDHCSRQMMGFAVYRNSPSSVSGASSSRRDP